MRLTSFFQLLPLFLSLSPPLAAQENGDAQKNGDAPGNSHAQKNSDAQVRLDAQHQSDARGVSTQASPAADHGVGDNSFARTGLNQIDLPLAQPTLLSAALSAGYGLVLPVYDLNSSSHQLGGRLSLSVQPLSWMTVSASLAGSWQTNPGEANGKDTSAYGKPSFGLRLVHPFSESFHLGAMVDVELIGRDAPSIYFPATTPTFSLLAAYQLEATTFGLSLGYRLDNSARAINDPTTLRAGDRVLLGASDSSSIPLGIGVAHRVADTEYLLDFQAFLLTGRRGIPLSESKMKLALGARHHLNPSWALNGQLGVSLSKNPSGSPDRVQASDPRISALLGIRYRPHFGQERAADEQAEQANEEPRGFIVERRSIHGKVVDEAGEGVVDVEVFIDYQEPEVAAGSEGADAEPSAAGESSAGAGKPEPTAEQPHYQQLTRSDGVGNFSFEGVPVGEISLRTKTYGFDDSQKTYSAEQGEEPLEIIIYPAVPAGEVKGRVLTLGGQGLRARILISPTNQQIETAADGSYRLELAPGRYTLTFKHPDKKTQRRTIVISDRGVIALDIALH